MTQALFRSAFVFTKSGILPRMSGSGSISALSTTTPCLVSRWLQTPTPSGGGEDRLARMLAESQAQLAQSGKNGDKKKKTSKGTVSKKSKEQDPTAPTKITTSATSAASLKHKYTLTEQEESALESRMVASRMPVLTESTRGNDTLVLDAVMKHVLASPLDAAVLSLHTPVLLSLLRAQPLDSAEDTERRAKARAHLAAQGHLGVWTAATRHFLISKFCGRQLNTSALNVLRYTIRDHSGVGNASILARAHDAGAIDAIVDVLYENRSTTDTGLFINLLKTLHALITPPPLPAGVDTTLSNGEGAEAALASGAMEVLVAAVQQRFGKEFMLGLARQKERRSPMIGTHIRTSMEISRVFFTFFQSAPHDAVRRAHAAGLFATLAAHINTLIVPLALFQPREAHTLNDITHLFLDLLGTLLVRDLAPATTRQSRLETLAALLVDVCRAFPNSTPVQHVCAEQVRRVMLTSKDNASVSEAIDYNRFFARLRSEPVLAAVAPRSL